MTLAINAKRSILLNGGVLFLNPAHIGEPRAFPQPLLNSASFAGEPAA